MKGLPPGSTVTVTASPTYGLLRTVEVTEWLVAHGYHAVPHLSARMVNGRNELAGLVSRLEDAGIDQAFVIGGDASPPAGPYHQAADLLAELADLGHPFARLGVGGYPEGHPLIPEQDLLDALLRKQAFASHVVTQMCFDADALAGWVRSIRRAGVELPVVVGLPGVVERRKLAEISLQTGVGASLRYLRKNRRQLTALLRGRHYDPTGLARAVAGRLEEAGLAAAGAHLFTFNQLGPTSAWVQSLAGAPGPGG